MTGERILITGASGFVGSAVARAFEQRGYDLTLLVRPSSPRVNVAGLRCELVEGDMKDAASLRRALKDIRYLVHVAADYRLWARDPAEIVRNNVEGTRTVMQAALDAGVEKVVYTSSVATLKSSHVPASETARSDERTAIGAYKRSKVAAERAVEETIACQSLPAVIVNPSTPVGPRDVKPTPTGRIVVETAMGRIPAFVDTGLNLVHVDDVAEGHVLALEKGRVGESYILGGENVLLKTMLETIARLAGRRPPRVKLPRTPLFPIAYIAEAAARFTGKEPLITSDGLKMAKHHMFFTSAKAERELGYRARPYAEGLAGAIKWFRDSGYLK